MIFSVVSGLNNQIIPKVGDFWNNLGRIAKVMRLILESESSRLQRPLKLPMTRPEYSSWDIISENPWSHEPRKYTMNIWRYQVREDGRNFKHSGDDSEPLDCYKKPYLENQFPMIWQKKEQQKGKINPFTGMIIGSLIYIQRESHVKAKFNRIKTEKDSEIQGRLICLSKKHVYLHLH